MNSNFNTTPSTQELETQFLLLSKQLQNAVNIADQAFADQTPRYQAACHLIGIAAYVNELAQHVKAGLERRKI